MKNFFLATLFSLFVVSVVWAQEDTHGKVLFILDGSGSMWGRIENKPKISIAKEAMINLIQELPEGMEAGLQVYGHRSKGDCDDIELLSPVGQSDRATLIEQIQSIKPRGKTPITQSFVLAGEQLREAEEETSVVLISDGKETCDADPCVMVRELRDRGIKVRVHVVGFDVNAEEREQLVCIAEAGGGKYFSAESTDQLKVALTEVVKEAEVKEEIITARPTTPTNTIKIGLGKIVVKPLNKAGFPAIKQVFVTLPGKRLDYHALSTSTGEWPKRSANSGEPIVVPPGEYVVTYFPANYEGQTGAASTIVLRESATVAPGQTVTIDPNEEVSGIVVRPIPGTKLKRLFVVPAGASRSGYNLYMTGKPLAVVSSYNEIMVVAANKAYDVVMDVEGGTPFAIVENITPTPGGLLELGQ